MAPRGAVGPTLACASVGMGNGKGGREYWCGGHVATAARRERRSACGMLTCLSHASRWAPANVADPAGAVALQCLASKLAAEGATSPSDISEFSAGEAREMFPCLRECSVCFTEALVARAREVAHVKAKRPRENAAEALSQVARAAPPYPPR